MEKGRWLQRIPLGGGLQAPDNWIRYGFLSPVLQQVIPVGKGMPSTHLPS